MEEQWKAIPSFEGIYEISNFGSIKSLKRKGKKSEKILTRRFDNYGYVHYLLCKNGVMYPFRAHVLVARMFVPNPLGKPHVNHLDGNKSNPNFDNLEWCTHSENHKHAYITGLKKIPSTKLTEEQVLSIYNSKDTSKNLSILYGVTTRTVCQIRANDTWTHITNKK